MKIIFIPHLPSLYGRRYNLSQSLRREGHEVHFITWDMPYPLKPSQLLSHLAGSWRPQTYERDGLTVHKIWRLPLFWPIINGLIFRAQVRRIFKELGADLIISQAYTNETELSSDLPFIYDLNDDHIAFAQEYGSIIYKAAYRLLGARGAIDRQCRNALAITAVSQRLLKFANSYHKPTLLLPNGVDGAAVKEVLSESAPAKRNNNILYVSTFGKWSRVIEVIKAVESMAQSLPDVSLTLCGGGTEASAITDYIKQAGLKRTVTYLGHVQGSRPVYRLMRAAAVCLNISDKNAFRDSASPIKIFEYSAFGKAIVSSRLDEVTSLKFNNILILPDEKETTLQQYLQKALSQTTSFKEVSEHVLAEYTWDSLGRQLSSWITSNLSELR